MEFPRQKYWSGLPFPSPDDLLDPGIKIKPVSPALRVDSLPLSRVYVCVCVCVCVYTPGIQNYQAPNKIQFTIPDSHRRAASKETGKYNGKK